MDIMNSIFSVEKSPFGNEAWSVVDQKGWRIAACLYEEHAEVVCEALNVRNRKDHYLNAVFQGPMWPWIEETSERVIP